MLFKNVTVEGGQTHDLNKFGKLCTLPRLEPRTQKCALPRGTSARHEGNEKAKNPEVPKRLEQPTTHISYPT